MIKKDSKDYYENNDVKRRYEDFRIALYSDFETGNGYDFKKFEEKVYSFKPIRDGGKDIYSRQAYYFKIRVKSKSREPYDILLTAIADYDDTWKGWGPLLKSPIWIKRNGVLSRFDDKKVKITKTTIAMDLILDPLEELEISNMPYFSYTEMKELVDDILYEYPTFLKKEVIGITPLGNEIISIKVDPSSPNWNNPGNLGIIISGSPQPNEIGNIAAIKVLRKFLQQGSDYWDDFYENFKLEFIFFQNPDGIIRGKNMVNSEDQNVFFGFTMDLIEDRGFKTNEHQNDETSEHPNDGTDEYQNDGTSEHQNNGTSEHQKGETDNNFISEDSAYLQNLPPKESFLIWRYFKQLAAQKYPYLYLEFHSFFQDQKSIRPYSYPFELFKNKNKKKVYKRIIKNLTSFCNGAVERVKLGQPFFKDTLAYRLQEQYNILGIQFKLHTIMDLDTNYKLAFEIFEKIVKYLRKHAIRTVNSS